MLPDHRSLAERVSAETGLEFDGTDGRDSDGARWIELQPVGHPAGQTFAIRAVIGWRRIDVQFRPGSFAGDLMDAMGSADDTGRHTFRSILIVCREAGAEVTLTVNGNVHAPEDDAIWETPWRSFGLAIRKGMLSINEGDPVEDMRQIELWTFRTAAAILAILPLEIDTHDSEETSHEVLGLPEGAKARIEVNRYERDRRNRAAALAIHGYVCKVCNLNMGDRYGPVAAGFIQVHHVTPVSVIGEGYVINPKTDLVPLCPNCHSVAHRRTPPYSVDELRQMLDQT
jgi:5-methylcytosine-specific restriction protein A